MSYLFWDILFDYNKENIRHMSTPLPRFLLHSFSSFLGNELISKIPSQRRHPFLFQCCLTTWMMALLYHGQYEKP